MNDPDVFRKHIDTVFEIQHDASPVELRLVEVADENVGGGIQQFSLLFHGPAERLLLQGVYAFRHRELGTFDLFIVPIVGSNSERIVYQACFSRPAPTSETPLKP